MRLNPKQRRYVIRSINIALIEFRDDGAQRAEIMRRISRMIASLNGVHWPE